jgi:hypothetical protein
MKSTKRGFDWTFWACLMGTVCVVALALTGCEMLQAAFDAETAGAAYGAVKENLPSNPTNLTGWLYAAGAALLAGGGVAAKKAITYYKNRNA